MKVEIALLLMSAEGYVTMSAEVLNATRKYTKFLYSVEIRVKSVELLPQFGQKENFEIS